jgi:glutamate synthase domain-containing protein 3
MASLGIHRVNELIGRTDLLEVNKKFVPWKARHIDFRRILYQPDVPEDVGKYFQIKQDQGIEQVLDLQLIAWAGEALEKKRPVRKEWKINNANRATGAMLSGAICKRYAEEALPEDAIWFKFNGIAGQSFAAWLVKGVTFELEGLANDYVGKGLSGGKVIIYPDKKAGYEAQENIIMGNTCFYGAIAGEAYIRGVAGERFCIRNSGLYAVVEGVGDHGCEYMTGGRVVVVGRTGRNFAAGMSGGIAYVFDVYKTFKDKCNLTMVELEELLEEDKETIKNLLANHYRYTQSPVAKGILDDLNEQIKKFIKVMPIEYKHILEAKVVEEKLELVEVSDG